VPVNCIRCKAMIPQADITARMTAKDKNGNFFCARCTIDLASQMGVKLGGPQGTQPPAGLPGQTVVLSRTQLQPRPPSAARVETATHHPGTRPGTRPGTGPVPRVGSGPVPRPGTGPVPRVSTGGRPGSGSRIGRATTRPLPGLTRAGTTRRMPPPEAVEPEAEGYYEEEAPIPAPPRRRMSSKTMALLSVGAVVLIAIVFTIVMMRQSSEKRAQELRFRQAKAALGALEDAQRERPRDFEQQERLLRDFVEKAQGLASYEKTAAQKREEIETNAKKAKEFRQAAGDLAALERDSDDPQKTDRIARELGTLKPRLDPLDREVNERFDVLFKKVSQQRVLGLFNEAKALAEKEPNSHDAILAKLGEAHAAALKVGGALDYLVRDILVEDDRVASLKYTAAFIDSVPWIDLMTAEWRGQWKKSPPPEALDVQTGGTEWTLTGKDVPGVSFGVYYIGSEKGWRDVVVETEVVIEQFGFSFFGRCGRPEKPVRYDVRAKQETGITEGQPYKMTFSVTGLQGKVEIADVGVDKVPVDALGASSGGVGIVLDPGARIRVKSFKVKVLRADTK